MAKPKKQPNGKWRVRVYIYTDENDKKHYKSVTADTKAECIYQAAKLAENKPKPPTPAERAAMLTVGQVIDQYIDLSQTLSPTTLSAYRKVRQYAFPDLMETKVNALDDVIVQQAINSEIKRKSEKTGKPLSAKTIKNEWGVVSSALHTICKKTFDVRLPRVQHSHADLPEPAAVMAAVKGSKVELPVLLAMWMSFSMSEIRGLTCESVKGMYLSIDQVVVDVDGAEVIKADAKTAKRNRTAIMPPEIVKLINNTEAYQNYLKTGENRPLIGMTRNEIYHHYSRLIAKQGIDISFHDLRHIYASTMLTKLGAPSKVVQDAGGWSSPYVMDRVYSNMFSAEREAWAERRDEFFRGCMGENMTKSMTQGQKSVEK